MDPIGRVLISLLGTRALTSALGQASISSSQDTSGKSVKKRLNELFPELKSKKVSVKEGPTSVTFKGEKEGLLSAMLASNPKYEVRGSKNEGSGAIAHEAGHILNDDSWGRPGRAINLASRELSDRAQPVTVLISAGMGEPSYGPALVQAALGAPMVLDEALASSRAAHRLISTKGLAEGIKETLPLVPALGSYLSHVAAPAIVTAIRRI